MKKTYDVPMMEILTLESEEIITASEESFDLTFDFGSLWQA